MNNKNFEIRTLSGSLSLREQGGESRIIEGRAIVFNSESEILDDFGERFREIILPEAVTMNFLKTQDIKLNLLHDRNNTLARWNKGSGTLRLEVDSKGLTFSFEAPKCDIGDRCLEMVRRGDYSGCSFEFYPLDYVVEKRNGGKDIVIKHRKFSALVALTIGLDPAYKQTSVTARELATKAESDLAIKTAYLKRRRELMSPHDWMLDY